jgi:hypothetical protein
MSEPITKCGACEQADDHPKHMIHVGVTQTSAGPMHHAHDFDHNGTISYHFDCPSEWHDLHAALAVDPFDSPDDDPTKAWLAPQASQHRAIADKHAAIVQRATEGVHGDELRKFILQLHSVSGGAGGIDQTRANHILDALGPNSGTKTIGVDTITGPINGRFMTANGSDSSAGTELTTGSGYTAGTGVALAFAAAASGSKATNAAASITNMPSCTLTGMEQWDSSGTPLRTFWGPWSGGNIVVASGNTFTISSAGLTDALA